jgi:glycerol-3-phosphate acyltransferase PlsX
VCDGFTGNVVLKTSEGVVEMIEALAGRALDGTLKRFDHAEYGGALLLGVAGLAIVCHGRSSSKAVRNAIAMAYRMASSDFIDRVEREIAAAAVS